MASRVISYVFTGQFANLHSGLAQTSAKTKAASTDLKALEAQAARTNKSVSAFGTSLAGSLGVKTGVGAVGIAAAAGLGAMVTTTMKFDQAMSNVQAATHATSGAMSQMREAALDAGKSTAFSATEAAGAIEELSKAGVSTKDIIGGGLAGALNLAAAGAVDVGEAAEIAASAMTQFGLSGDDVGHVADLLSAGAGKAQGSVHDLGMALNQSGLVASQTGLTIEETTGTLAAFASAGLIGSDAGTSFKTMLQSLTPSSKAAADTMHRLGISAYDSQGNFIGMTKFAGQLRTALSGLSVEQQNAALKTIFGSDAVRAASVIYSQGADGIQGWIDKTNDAGYAAETAAARLNNLAGDLDKLKGAIEATFIESGEGSQGLLRTLTQDATDFLNLGIASKAEQTGQSIIKQALGLDALGFTIDKIGRKFGRAGGEAEKAKEPTRAYSGSIAALGSSAVDTGQDIDSMVKSMQDQRKASLSAFDAVTQYGAALKGAQDAAAKGRRGINANTAAGRENRKALSELAAAWNNQSDAVRNNQAKFRQARRDFIETATAMGVPTAAARRLARQILDIPNAQTVTIAARTDQAEGAIAHINDRLASLHNKTIYVSVQESYNSKRAGMKQAAGGPVLTIGGPADHLPKELAA